MTPPGMEHKWDDNAPWQKAMIISYDQVRQYEEAEELGMMLKAGVRM